MVSNKMLVFDDREWSKTGDIEDNSQFWKPATIVRIYIKNRDCCGDVIFDHRQNEISHGHFVAAMLCLN